MAAFSTTALGAESPLFRGRQAELARLLRLCRGEANSYVALYGGRQNGKTSLLLRLEAALRPDTPVCRLEFQLIKGATAERAFTFLAEQIAQALPLTSDPRLVSDGPALRNFLSQALARPELTRFVLILDEWGALPAATREVLANAVRSLFDARLTLMALAKLQVVFSGGVELYNLMVAEASSLHSICEELYLIDLAEPEAVALVADGLRELGLDAQKAMELGKAVYARVAGHPYLTQRFGTLLARAYHNRHTLLPATIDAVAQHVRQGDPLLRRIRHDLRKYELEDAAQRLLREPPPFTRLDDEMARLELIGLARPSREHWTLRNRLLGEVLCAWLGVPLPTPLVPPEVIPAGLARTSVEASDTIAGAPEAMPRPISSYLAAQAATTPAKEYHKPAHTNQAESTIDQQPTEETGNAEARDQFQPVNSDWRGERRTAQVNQRIPPLNWFLAGSTLLALLALGWYLLGVELAGRGAPQPTTAPMFTTISPLSGAAPIASSPITAALPANTPVTTTTPSLTPLAEAPLSAWVPELIHIPKGPFLMGITDSIYYYKADDDERPQHRMELPDFWIGKTEVTNAQFRSFVEGDGYQNQAYWTEMGWAWRQENNITQPEFWEDMRWNAADQPVVGVSWFEAVAYVRWLSAMTGHEFRLPTEAEWEKAARGPDGRIYPWGDESNEMLANVTVGKTTSIDLFSSDISYYGVLGMAGNAQEWCATEWRKSYPYQLEDEWTGSYLEGNVMRAIRGGAWWRGLTYATSRDGKAPADWGLYPIGFRVATQAPLSGLN